MSDLIETLRLLVEKTKDLDYNPSEEAWVCGPHGVSECHQGAACKDLPWPEPNADPLLGHFQCWADAEYSRIMRPYDLSDDPNMDMPEEGFRSYSVTDWPLGDVLDSLADLP